MNANVQVSRALTETRVGFSSREYFDMLMSGAFGDMRVELVRGELRKMMPAHWKHGESNVQLILLLAQAYQAIGARIGNDVIIEIEEGTTRAADISVVKPRFAGEGALKGSDLLLAVEIANTSLAEDLGDKAEQYARCGIPHYWVVDLNARAVHVMGAPSAEGYAERTIVRFGEPLAAPETDRTIVID